MSFLDCIAKKAAAKLLKNSEVKALTKKYDTLFEKYKTSMGDETAAAKAASDLVSIEANIQASKNVNAIRHALAQKRIVDDLDKKTAEGAKFESAVADLYEKTWVRRGTILKQSFSNIDQFIDRYRSKFAGLYRDSEGVIPVIRELLGEKTGNREAAAFGRSLREAYDISRTRFKQAGGIIGKIDNYFPQYHTRELIKKVSFDEWYNFFRSRLDVDKMTDMDTGLSFTEDALKVQMKADYESITTNGKSELLKRAEAGEQTYGFGSDVSERAMDSRFYHFKDADAFLEYNEKFGSGRDGLYDMVINSFESSARNTAMLEVLGPKPNAIARHLNLQMDARGANFTKRAWVNGMYDVLSGRVDGSVSDSAWFSVLANTQNILRSALLGSAPLSAISDSTFIVATARLNGLSGTKAIARYAKMLNPASSADRALAKRHGYIADIARGRAIADTRFAGESMGGKATSWLASFTTRAGGLQTMTKAAADAVSLELEATLAETSKVAWKDLAPEFRGAAAEHGFTEVDWGILAKATEFTQPEDGINFLRSNDVLNIKGHEAKDLLRIANQIDDWSVTMRALATNEPTLRMRSLSTGAFTGEGRRGSVNRALFSSLFMLKSFPVTVMFNHVAPAFRAAGQGKIGHLATVAIGTTLLGALAIQSKEIVKGRDPRDTDDWKFWQASMLQGGGLGLFGDLLFSDYDRFGRNPVTNLVMGPVGGLGADMAQYAVGNFGKAIDPEGKTNWARDTFNLAKRNTPAINLWYSRLFVERTILDNLEKMVDPKFDRHTGNMEKQFYKDYGQEFWWPKGESEPKRAPKL